LARNIYYTDSMRDEIGVVSMDGKYRRTLIKDVVVNPRALAIDLVAKRAWSGIHRDWEQAPCF
jgi:hypothetical protein